MNDSFSRTSPLGMSVALFLAYGAIHLLTGGAYALVAETELNRHEIFFTPASDQALFGAPPADLLRDDQALVQLRSLTFLVIAAVLVGLAIAEFSLTWFGLREGRPWALITLAVSGLAMFPFWALLFRPYLAAGASLGLFEVQPWIWMEGVLLVPATVLGWVGLGRTDSRAGAPGV